MQNFTPDRLDTPAGPLPANDNLRHRRVTRSLIPSDAVAQIFRPGRAVTTSGKARPKGWRMTFERRSPPFIEPLMGWTGGDDPLVFVELSFPTLRSAIRYAQREGIPCVLQMGADNRSHRERSAPRRAFAERTLQRLGLDELRNEYGVAAGESPSVRRSQSKDWWSCPMDVVRDKELAVDDKRRVLMNWAWHEYLADQMARGAEIQRRSSRLCDVEQAMIALESAEASQAPNSPHEKGARAA